MIKAKISLTELDSSSFPEVVQLNNALKEEITAELYVIENLFDLELNDVTKEEYLDKNFDLEAAWSEATAKRKIKQNFLLKKKKFIIGWSIVGFFLCIYILIIGYKTFLNKKKNN